MNKYRFFAGFSPARPLAVFAVAMSCWLGLSLVSVQAQGFKPSTTLRAPSSAAAPAAAPQRAADYIVVVVNSEPITNNEVRLKLLRTEQQLQQRGTPMPPRAELLREVLERMISDKAQLQAAQAANIKIEDNAVNGAVETVAQQNQITVDELMRRLKIDGIEASQFRSDLRDELMVRKLRQREVDSRITVTEQDIDQYLRDEAKPSQAATQGLNLGEILIAVPENASPAQVTALQAKAQQVLERARAGGDFAALATEFSNSASRSTGGEMGLRSVDRYPPLFVDATAKLRAGELAGPVRSGAGFHILKVLEKRQAGLPDVMVRQTHARHILLRLKPEQDPAAAIEKLAEMKKRIASGQVDFAQIARESSQDGSAKEGGDLGWVPAGAFVPEFEKIMNALGPNEISDPVVTRFGVHLIQVLERRDVPVSDRDRREMVRGLLREKKQNEAYVTWAQDIRARAYVELREATQ